MTTLGRLPRICAALCAVAAAGCASTRIAAQWKDPQLAPQALRGQRVLVVCRAENGAARQVCEDQLKSRLQAAGVTPMPGPRPNGAPGKGAEVDVALLDAGREVGATAVFLTAITADASVVTPGPSVGIGVGGYGGSGGWHGSSGVGAGVGVNVPVGAGQVETAYAADMVVTDVASGRILWTSKVTTGASRDLGGQIATLTETGVRAAQKAGLF